MEENAIKSYLDSHETIQFQVTRQELEDPKKSARYFALLDYFGAHPQEAGKFCNRLLLAFHPSCGTDLWENEAATAFVKRLTAYPYLFFLAEKEGETLKFLTALSCRKGGLVGDNLSLDKDLFNELLQKQMKGILIMSQAAHFSPENAKSIMDSVFTYFGMDN